MVWACVCLERVSVVEGISGQAVARVAHWFSEWHSLSFQGQTTVEPSLRADLNPACSTGCSCEAGDGS